jgi:hypothetical protein
MAALTRLHLGPASNYVGWQPDGNMGIYSRTPWLESLTALQWLCLERVRVEPSQLHGLSELAYLHLAGASFNPSDLLGMLGQLTRLQRLHIVQEAAFGWGERYGDPIWPAPSALFTGLTASSRLQEIVLDHCMLPVGIWPHAFPAGRLLPELRSLYAPYGQHIPADARFEVEAGQHMPDNAGSGSVADQHAPVGAGPGAEAGLDARSGLACITAACPNIQRLCVW